MQMFGVQPIAVTLATASSKCYSGSTEEQKGVKGEVQRTRESAAKATRQVDQTGWESDGGRFKSRKASHEIFERKRPQPGIGVIITVVGVTVMTPQTSR